MGSVQITTQCLFCHHSYHRSASDKKSFQKLYDDDGFCSAKCRESYYNKENLKTEAADEEKQLTHAELMEDADKNREHLNP